MAGAVAGAALADAMFAVPVLAVSAHHRGGGPLLLSEVVATAGLLLVIVGLARTGRAQHAPWAVAAWIGAAYWFTASTSFANPAVVAAMAEIGLDISREIPKPLTSQAQTADIVITMGCGDACPVYPGKRYLDWDLPDPAGLTVDQVRPIRDEVARRVAGLLAELGGSGDGAG